MPKPLADYAFSDARIASIKSVQTSDDGSLVIEGFGALYEIDREEEAFLDGAFSRGLKSFLEGNAQLVYHHQLDKVIGRVVDAKLIEGKGMWVRAIVDSQPTTSPLYHIYRSIKNGTVDGFSVGGYFRRKMTSNGPRIVDVDMVELSCTGSPVGKNSRFSVIAGKAIGAYDADVKALREDVELAALRVQVARMRETYQQHAGPQAGIKAVPVAAPTPEYVEPTPAPNDGDVAARQLRWEDRRRTLLAGRYAVEDKARAAGDEVPVWIEDLPATAPRWFEREDRVLTVSATTNPLQPGEVELPTNMDVLGRMPMPPLEDLLTPDEQNELASAPERRESLMARVKARFKPLAGIEPQFASREPTYVATREPSVEDVFRQIAERNAPLEGETPEQHHARLARYDEQELGIENE